jgi:magnesium-transporting ATPase (P-type)
MSDLGIKLIAVLHWLRALVYLAGGLAILGFAHLSTRMISAVASDTPLNRVASGFGNALGIGALVIALIWLILGIGIWSVKNWARVVTLVLAGFSLLYQLLMVATYHTSWHIVRVLVEAAIVVYLMLPDVKRAFSA